MYRTPFLVVLVSLVTTAAAAETVVPLPQAHSHNDYLHDRPLLDALALGFCSVEADVFLIDGELLVGHSEAELQSSRTLEALYLAPLKARVLENRGRVFRDGPIFTLLVDIKSDAKSTYAALRKTLYQYSHILTEVKDGQVEERAVVVVVSGNRPQGMIAADRIRLVGIDGRLSDLNTAKTSSLMPLISDRWTSHFSWRGVGPMPSSERQKLNDFVSQAHESGRRLRFWATPDSPPVWRELIQANVDLINTDDLIGLQRILLRERPLK